MSYRLIKFLRRAYHYAVYAAGGAVIVVCIVALSFKFWVIPNIGGYKGVLEQAAGKAIGQPVEIGALNADWHGLNPRVTLRDVRMTPPTGAPLLLPRVEAVVSWLSLPLFDARLASLTLDQPHLAMRRDARGVIYVAGIPVNVDSAPSPFPNWLLKQPRIVIKDAQITWQDEKLDAPELRFSRVRLLLENRFGHHRVAGIAQPSAAAAGRLELRGDLKGDNVHAWNTWSGEVYARVDDIRLESWKRWVPWAQGAVKGGGGNLRFWLTLKNGQVADLAGDASLKRVAINLQQDLPDMEFDSLSGHIGWSREKDSNSFFVERLRFKRPGGEPAEPASLRVTLTPDGKGGFKRVGASAKNLRLEAFTALTGAIPLPRRGHDLIEAFNPRGLVENAEGHWAGSGDYALKLRVREAGIRAHENIPGFAGVSARIEANQEEGKAELEGGLALDWPQLFRHGLSFDRIEARADWKIRDTGMQIDFDVPRLVNGDLDGTAEGRVELPRTGAPKTDIRAHLSRGQADAVYRYLPLSVSDDAYHWLKRGLIGGHSDDVRLILKGPLDRFPFHQGGGEFRVSINMVDGMLDYAPGWPNIRNVRGTLVFHDRAMTLDAVSGNILDTRIGPVKVFIPDLHSGVEEIVSVEGRASGETRAFLDFIRLSPVNEHTNGFTEQFKATGNGDLAISLRLPVRHIDTSTVKGNFTFQDNRLDPGGELPELEGISGMLSFTEKDLQAKGIRVRLLGQPAVLDINSGGAESGKSGAQLRVKLAGRVGAEGLKPYLPAALAGRLSGATDWHADIGLDASRKAELTVTSDLTGLAVDLPAPLGKNAAQSVALNVVKQPAGKGGEKGGERGQEKGPDILTARYGDILSARAKLPDKAAAQISVRLGPGEAPPPSEAGVTISGVLRALDLDAWRSLDLPAGGGGPALREASVTFNELRILNRRLHDTHVRLRPAGNGWNIVLAGREITGEIATIPDGKAIRVLANLRRLSIPDPEPGAAAASQDMAASLRAIDLSADSLAWKGRELGELHLRLSPVKQGLQVDNFRISRPEGQLEGRGVVADHPRRPTRLELNLSSDNLGKLMAQLGSPGRIKNGATKISGTLGWMGGVEDFNFATLGGDLSVAVKQGQFLKVDPGAAKLLGILSLQALPRRVALDFRDIFSEGFAFDEIAGNVHLERGSAYAKDLRMNGPAAKISMSGVVDLDRETQNLRINIQPRLEDTVAVAGALIGGPVVGLGTLIANKVLKNPIGQAVTFEYTVTGSWSDPIIGKIPRNGSNREKTSETP